MDMLKKNVNQNQEILLDVRNLHDQLVQPVTYLNAAIELWEQGMNEPDDVNRMKQEIEKLVEVVREMQAQLRSENVSLVAVV